VNRLELRVGLGLSFEIHLAEHVQSRLFTNAASSGPSLAFDASFQLPSTLIAAQAVRLTVLHARVTFRNLTKFGKKYWTTYMAGGNYLILSIPNQAIKG
jgi:hypothetical protein